MTFFATTQELDTFLRERRALRSGGSGLQCTGVTTDSRKVERGQLFVALKGDNFDGHQFVSTAKAQGACGAVVAREWAQANKDAALPTDGFALWSVDDTLLALGDVARGHLRRLPLTKAALTGSNGKTTTKEFCAAILKAHFSTEKVLYTQGNLNNQVGMPLTALRATGEHQVALFEMGMNHAGEIAAMCRVAEPSAALITNVGPAHIGNFDGRMDGIADAKGEIFAGVTAGGTVVVNLDDPYVVRQAQKVSGAQQVTFGRNAKADFRLSGESATPEGLRFHLDSPHGGAEVSIPALGAHNALNACGAAALAVSLGATLSDVVTGLLLATTVSGRLTQRKAQSGALVLDDSYNANPASMKAAMDVAKQATRPGQRLILVLGDMLELGTREIELHHHVGLAAAQARPALLFAAGVRSKATAEGAVQAGLPVASVMHSDKLEDLLPEITRQVGAQDVVLVKGSRGARMERAVVALCGGADGKGH